MWLARSLQYSLIWAREGGVNNPPLFLFLGIVGVVCGVVGFSIRACVKDGGRARIGIIL